MAGTILALNSACAPITREVRHPGGYPGYVLDARTFNASGRKQLQLLRATLILAMAARMSEVTVAGEDADAFAEHLAAAAQEIRYAAADIYPVGDKGPCTTIDSTTDCPGYFVNFEAGVAPIEARLLRVMLAVLPTDKARQFLDDVAKGDVLSAAWSALGALTRSLGGLHFAMGAYRSGLEVVAESMGEQCVLKPQLPSAAKAFDSRTMTVTEAAGCLGLSQDDLFGNPQEATRKQLSNEINANAFRALMRVVATSCIALPYTGNADTLEASAKARNDTCAKIEFIPTSRPLPRKNETAQTEAPTGEGQDPAPPVEGGSEAGAR